MFGPLTSDALATFQASVGLVEEPVSPDTADALMGRVPRAAGSPVSRRARRANCTAVTDAGTKLVQSKLVLDLAASGLRQAGTDIGISTRPGAGGVQAGLTIANQLIEASTLIAAAGAKMIAGGRAPAPSRSRVGTSSWGCDAAMGSTSARKIAGRVSYSSRSGSTSECPPSSRSTACSVQNAPGAERIPARHPGPRDRRRRPGHRGRARDWAHRRPGRRGTGRGGAGVRRSALADVGVFIRQAATSLALSIQDPDLRASPSTGPASSWARAPR